MTADFNFEKMVADAQAAEEANVINAIAQAPRTLDYQQKITTYRLAEPVLVTISGKQSVVFQIRRTDTLEDDESFTDIEGFMVEATAKGQPRKGGIKAWRYLPSALASLAW